MSAETADSVGAGAAFLALRQELVGHVLDAGFTVVAQLARLHPRARAERYGVRLERDLAYVDDGRAAHRLDVYVPPGPGPWPVVLYLHGGSFRVLSKETHWPCGLALARMGCLVVNANYRLSPAHPFPAALEDAATAYHWVRQHAGSFGADVNRVVLAGESAGANLCVALTVAACGPAAGPVSERLRALITPPQAVMPACGILQVSAPERFARSSPQPFWIRDRIAGVGRAYLSRVRGPAALADPLCLLEGEGQLDSPLPPFFVGAGLEDPILEDSQRLVAALGRRGAQVVSRWYEGQPHAFQLMVWREAARRFWEDTRAFLEQAVGLRDNPDAALREDA